MSESNLGTAVLSLRVDTGSALQALTQFRQQAERELQNTGEINFNGVTRQARQSGQQAGRALAEGIRQATQGVRFDSITEALDFSAALNGTLRDLRQYRDALVALRDVTNATAPGFYELNDAIEATTQAIRNYSSGTDALQDQAARIATRELSQELRRQRDAVLENARVDRQWGDALRTIEGAQRSAAAATREANQAFRDQVSAVGSLAQKGAKDVGGTIGAIGRGVGAAARGAINLGKAGYSLGAEFGVFEEPRTGPVKKAIQEVVDRFKFLGEQAETTRGIILRSFEGAGAAAGLAAIAQNADQLKAALNGLSTAAKTTDAAVGGIAKLGQYLADVFNNGGWLTDNGKTIIGQLLNISAATEKAAASSVSLGDQLIQLGAGAAGGALNGLEAVINVIGSIPPEAQAAVLALAGISVGFKEEPIIEGLTRVLEYLDGLKSKSLQVRGDLQNVLNGLEQFQQKLNSGNNQKLLPAFTERGLQVLDDTVREGQSFQRISDAIGSSWERGARYLEKSNEEMRRLIEQGLELKQLGTGPSGIVPQQTNQLPPGAPASIRPNPNQYATPGATAPALPRQLLEDDLAEVQARRLAIEEERAEVATKALALDQKEFAIRRFRFGGPTSVGIDGRLPDGTFAPGSPGDIASQRKEEERRLDARRKSFKEAGANALIGGAFPLLFGQGLGASIGGGLGGGVGGLAGGQFGFGASLVGTAIGTAVDELNRRFGELSVALLSPVESFNKLKEASVLASRAQDGYIQALIDAGKTAQAAQEIQKEAGKTIDPGNALLLAGSTDVLNRAFSDLQDRLGSFTAGAGQAFNNWLARLINTVAGTPAPNQPLTGPQAVRNAQNQRATGAGIGTLGLGIAIAGATLATGGAALAIGGAGLALGGVGFGSALGATDKERVASSREVAAAEEKVRTLLSEQVITQQNINQAKALGLSKTAELIDISNQFQTAQVTAANQELQIQAQLAAGQISQGDAAKQLNDVETARKVTIEAIVAKQQEAAAVAAAELQSAQVLVGLKAQQRTIAQEQLKQEAAIAQYVQARATYEERRASGLASPEELDALKAAATEAGTKLQTALITGADAIKNASEEARKNFDSAAKALQSTSEGNFKFLTKAAQRQVLDQARGDIARGVESGDINPRFLRARKPEDVIAAANASRSQIQALDNFNKAAQDYSSAINQSNQALGSVTNQLPEVANKIVALQGSLDGLVNKDWTVNVSVSGDSAANVRVD